MMENSDDMGVDSYFQLVLSIAVPIPEFSALEFGVDFVQMGQCGPHPHISSALFGGGLFTIMWGIAAIVGGVLSSAFPC